MPFLNHVWNVKKGVISGRFKKPGSKNKYEKKYGRIIRENTNCEWLLFLSVCIQRKIAGGACVVFFLFRFFSFFFFFSSIYRISRMVLWM